MESLINVDKDEMFCYEDISPFIQISSPTIVCIGYHMRGEVISVLSLEGRCRILLRVSRVGARTLIGGGGCIFIYSGSARLVSFEINFISKETSRAEPEYMNIRPPPPQRSSADPACARSERGRNMM